MVLKFWIEGDHSDALCETCRGWRAITFSRRPLHLERAGVDVQNVLVGVCDVCGSMASIPHQSSRKLKAARNGSHIGSGDVFVDLEVRDASLMRRKADLAHAILDRLEEGAPTASIPPSELERIKNGRFRRMPLAQLEEYLREMVRAE